MKDKNLPNNYNFLSLEELTKEANKMVEDLENEKNLYLAQFYLIFFASFFSIIFEIFSFVFSLIFLTSF